MKIIFSMRIKVHFLPFCHRMALNCARLPLQCTQFISCLSIKTSRYVRCLLSLSASVCVCALVVSECLLHLHSIPYAQLSFDIHFLGWRSNFQFNGLNIALPEFIAGDVVSSCFFFNLVLLLCVPWKSGPALSKWNKFHFQQIWNGNIIVNKLQMQFVFPALANNSVFVMAIRILRKTDWNTLGLSAAFSPLPSDYTVPSHAKPCNGR